MFRINRAAFIPIGLSMTSELSHICSSVAAVVVSISLVLFRNAHEAFEIQQGPVRHSTRKHEQNHSRLFEILKHIDANEPATNPHNKNSNDRTSSPDLVICLSGFTYEALDRFARFLKGLTGGENSANSQLCQFILFGDIYENRLVLILLLGRSYR